MRYQSVRNSCRNCGEPAGSVSVSGLNWGVITVNSYCDVCANKKTCRCPSEFCRLEPENGAEMCPDLGEDEICGYR
jgi:hypothetical protein